MEPRDENDVVRLTTAPNPAQAHIWEQALRNEGIPCKVVGDYLDAGFGNMAAVLPEIWVHRQDLAKAQGVLEHRYHLPPERPWEEGHKGRQTQELSHFIAKERQ